MFIIHFKNNFMFTEKGYLVTVCKEEKHFYILVKFEFENLFFTDLIFNVYTRENIFRIGKT